MSLTCCLVPLLGCLHHLLVLALPVVREPAGDLLRRQASLVRQHGLVDLLDVRVIDMVQKPFLEHLGLLLGERETFGWRVDGPLLMLGYRDLVVLGAIVRRGLARVASFGLDLTGDHRFGRRRYAVLCVLGGEHLLEPIVLNSVLEIFFYVSFIVPDSVAENLAESVSQSFGLQLCTSVLSVQD